MNWWILPLLVCGCGEGVEPSWSEQIGGGPVRTVEVGPDGAPVVLGPAYVAKYLPGGARAWIWPDAQLTEAALLDVAVASDGRTFVLASFSSEIDWGGGSLTSEGQPDLVIVELGPGGTAEAARHIASEGVGQRNVIAVDDDNIAWVVGSFSGVLDLGEGPASPDGGAGTFIAGVAADGDVVAVDVLGGGATIEDIAVDAAGGVYLAGTMEEQPVDFGDGWTLDSSYDAFVIGRDGDRRTAWAYPIPSGAGVSTHAAVTVAADDSVIAAGNDLVLKIGAGGERRWSFTVEPCDEEPCGILNDVAADDDGGAFAVGVEFTQGDEVDSSDNHMAVWRLDARGGCAWAWRGGPDYLRGVAVDPAGNAVAVSDEGTLLGFDR